MHRSSEPIGAIAAALAKAQSKLINPEKSLVGNHRAFVAARLRASFPLCPLSSGLHTCATICLRDKEHQKSVTRQPCLVCGVPSDPHEPVWRSPVPPLFDQCSTDARTWSSALPPKSALASI
jgi:hypothetical protein